MSFFLSSGADTSGVNPVNLNSTSLVAIPDELEEVLLKVMVEMGVEEVESEGPVAVTGNTRQNIFEENQGYSARDAAGRCSTVVAMFTGGADRNEPGVRAETLGAVCELGEEVNKKENWPARPSFTSCSARK